MFEASAKESLNLIFRFRFQSYVFITFISFKVFWKLQLVHWMIESATTLASSLKCSGKLVFQILPFLMFVAWVRSEKKARVFWLLRWLMRIVNRIPFAISISHFNNQNTRAVFSLLTFEDTYQIQVPEKFSFFEECILLETTQQMNDKRLRDELKVRKDKREDAVIIRENVIARSNY